MVQVDGAVAQVLDPRSGVPKAQFAFDFCFDNCANAASMPSDQQCVFDAIAPPLLRSATEGYNVTVLAYGQSASGKTYTMLGTRDAPGFTPRFVEALFAECAAATRERGVECTFEASYMEIFMEQIRDLLSPAQAGAKQRLKVREHPQTGPYVEDLAKVACSSSEQVAILLEHGSSMRAVRATQMNAESSRSHAIFTLKLTQRSATAAANGALDDVAARRDAELVSHVHLVDLAGSERAKRTGESQASGGLQEAGAINKSLSTLGAVISALAAGRRSHVPYRESVLTYLLKDGLGGNARTTMLATVSPDAADVAESLSTLRYADSAKHIVNHAQPNVDPSVKLVAQLRAEIGELRSQLGVAAGGGAAGRGEAARIEAVMLDLGDSDSEKMSIS